MNLKQELNLQLFADAGTLVNASGNYVNAYSGETSAFPDGGGMTASMKTFYDTELLENARPELIHTQFARKQALPAGRGKTVEWRKWNTLEDAGALTEGVIPTGQKFGQSAVTQAITQYGTYVSVSDQLELHAIDDVILGAAEELGASAGTTQDKLVRNVAAAGTNVQYCDKVGTNGAHTAVTSRAGLDTTAKLTPDEVNKAVTLLKKLKAPKIDGKYIAIIHPSVAYDLRSSEAWIEAHMPFTMGGNENGRGNGERMMVDPQNGNIIYMGTRLHGLWRSTDKGRSWARVASFPNVSEKLNPVDRAAWGNRGSGIVCVAYDAQGTRDERGTRDIYVAVSLMGRENLFVSHDYGESWQPVGGQPMQYRPTHMVLTGDGQLVLTYGDTPGPSQMGDGGVWKYDIRKGKWTDISPVRLPGGEKAGFGYAAVSVDSRNPKHLIASTHSLGGKHGYKSDEMFRTTDGGKSWKPIFKTGYEYDYSKAPYTKVAPLHWMFDIEIDPTDAEHAMFTTGFGGWETFNLSAVEREEPVKWSIMSAGIEETVPLELYAPEKGARLISGIGDYGGFTHFDLNRPDSLGSHANPHFGNTNGVTGAWLKQDLVVRVGTLFGHQPDAKTISYSEDGGRHWTMCATVPTEKSRNGHIAVAADGSSWIWIPDRSKAYLTRDKGASWQVCRGLPKNIRVIADKVNPKRFYAVDAVAEILYSSEDGGATFHADTLNLTVKRSQRGNAGAAVRRGDLRGGQDRIYATPGREKDLWIAAYDGLYHSVTSEKFDFRVLDKVRTIYAFGFGKAKPGNDYPAIYLIGVINGQYGFFRSDDAANSWVRINDDAHQYGLVLHICGDMQEYGRVYIGTHGRGIVTGVPAS